MSKRYTIKRREASNIAKHIVLAYGLQAGVDIDECLPDRLVPFTDDDIALIEQYYYTHMGRVQDFLTR